MWLYSEKDVKNIVEEFLAKHFNLGSVYLNDDCEAELFEICNNYGVFVENIVEQ